MIKTVEASINRLESNEAIRFSRYHEDIADFTELAKKLDYIFPWRSRNQTGIAQQYIDSGLQTVSQARNVTANGS